MSPAPPADRRCTRVQLLVVLLLLAVVALLGAAGAAAAQSSAPAPPTGSAAQPAGGVPVSGTLNNRGQLLSGVVVRALDSAGAEVARATSTDAGRWSLSLPPGTYTFEVLADTLPSGVTVQGTLANREVQAGRVTPLIFSFGEPRTATQVSLAERVLRLSVDGLRFGLVIAITAVGLSLIYGTTGLTNFAHGELVTIGAVVALVVNVNLGVPLVAAAAIAVVVGVVVGALNDLLIWRPLRRRRSGLVAQLVVSIGLAIVLRYLVLLFFKGNSRAFADFQGQTEKSYGPVRLTDVNLSVIVISLVVLIGVALLLQRTRIGKAMRAVADNRDLAASSGIDVDRVVLFVWGLGGGLAALGGVLYGLSELAGTVQWEMGFKLLLLMFAGITLGGLGTAYGALVGCIIVGLLVQLSTLVVNPDLKYTGGLLVLIVILVLRPQGILGSRARIG